MNIKELNRTRMLIVKEVSKQVLFRDNFEIGVTKPIGDQGLKKFD